MSPGTQLAKQPQAFHPVLYFEVSDPRVGAGHPQRQSWPKICDPCEEYGERFSDQMAQMCE